MKQLTEQPMMLRVRAGMIALQVKAAISSLFARRFRKVSRARSKNSGKSSFPIFLRLAKAIVFRRRSESSKASSTRVQE